LKDQSCSQEPGSSQLRDFLLVRPFWNRIRPRTSVRAHPRIPQNVASDSTSQEEPGSWIRRRRHLRLPILTYHRIGPFREGFDESLTVSAEMFEQHLRWLSRKGYTPIHLADWVAYLHDGEPLPDKPVVLTFDDGYRDTAEFGFPLLKKYGFKGTLFLVTNHIGGANSWDLHLGVSEQPLMTADDVRFWTMDSIEVGSHSRTHPDLRTCTDEIIQAEMKQSRESLEEIVGKPVVSFAYPYGYLDKRAPEVARRIYDVALTSNAGVNSLSTDPMLLRRAMIIPRLTLGQMFWATHFGFNLLMVLRIQMQLRIQKLRVPVSAKSRIEGRR